MNNLSQNHNSPEVHFRFNIYIYICMVYLLLNNMSKTTLKQQQKY